MEPLGLIYYADNWHLIAHCRLRQDVRDFRSTTWEMDRFARGGYAVFGPDFKPEWRAELARATGRVVLAGEHTSRRWQGYMNGAVESGIRAARDIETMRLLADVL